MKTFPRLRYTFIGFVGWFFCFLIPGQAQNQSSSPAFAKLDSVVMQLMRIAKVPGLSLVLIRDAKPAYSQSYGLTKADSTQKVDTNTVFEAASLTKPTFAYAVLQLVEEGKLDLDKPLYEEGC
jgi:CubicO group peptidase (beta-lactamase class C family)